jgi:hypothetical protein
MKYLVEIIPESITDMQAATSSLAQTLKLDPAKAAALLKRNPITKPVSQAEAEKVARLFTKAGIEVFIRSEEEVLAEPVDLSPPPASPVIPPAPLPVHETTATREQNVVPLDNAVTTPSSGSDDRNVGIEKVAVQTVNVQTRADKTRDFMTPANLPSVVPEIDHTSSVKDETPDPASNPALEKEGLFQPTGFQNAATFPQQATQGEELFKIPSGFFTPVPESSVESQHTLTPEDAPSPQTTAIPSARGGLGKLAFASIVPGLLALAGVFTALYLLGLPLLRSQQRTAAETTATSLASSVAGWIGDVSLDNPTLSQQVQSVIAGTQPELRQRGIEFVLLSDLSGNPLAGWYKDIDPPGLPDTVTASPEVRAQLASALGAAEAGTGTNNPTNQVTLEGDVLELASAPVRQGETPVGAVIVGMSQQRLTASLQQPLRTTILAGVIPLLVGIVLSLLIGRKRR